MSRLSIRARITLGSVIIAALLLTAALLIVRAQVSTILGDADMGLAVADLAPFRSDITNNPDEKVDDPGTGVLVYVRDPSGDVQLNTLPHDVTGVVQHRADGDAQFLTADDEGRTFAVAGRVVDTSAGQWMLWSARSTAASDLAIDGLDRVLVVGGIVLLAAFGLAAWILASVALRPVARMREHAETLGDAIDGDLPVGEARDELAALATTLNDLLARVRTSTAREKQVISDAAHELRSPLSSLRTQLELAHDDSGDAAALERHLSGVEASVDRLSALATNLLELSRLEAHPLAGESTVADLTSELMTAIDRARMLALAKSVDVSLELDDLPADASAAIDRASFARVADNLLSNAVAAVAQGGHVSARLEVDGDETVLEIRDDGPGMPPSFIPHAFERFSRPDSSRTGASGGSGLGLSLVLAIVQTSGGSVALHNTDPGLAVLVAIPNM